MCVFRAIKCGSFLYKISDSASFKVHETRGKLQAAVVPLSQSRSACPIPPACSSLLCKSRQHLAVGGKTVLFLQLQDELLPKQLELLTLFQPNPGALGLLGWLLSEGHAWSLVHSCHMVYFPGCLYLQPGAGYLVPYLWLTRCPESNR